MKKRLVIIGTTVIIAVTSIGGFAFAQNRGRLGQNQPKVKPIIRNFNRETIVRDDNRAELQLQGQVVEVKEDINNNEYVSRHDDYGYGHQNMTDQYNPNYNMMHDFDLRQGFDDDFEHNYNHRGSHEGMHDLMHGPNNNQIYNPGSNQTYNSNYNSMHNSMMGRHGGKMGHGNGRHR